MWEAALLADGVAPDKLYPLDLKRAHDKIAAFKPNVVSYWGGGAASQQVLLSGDASMAIIWSTRASLLDRDSNGQIKFIWDQGLISPGALAVIKNNPGGKEAAMKFIASTSDPQKQLVMFNLLGQGPANPATDALIPVRPAKYNPVDPANFSKQAALDMPWYSGELRRGARRLYEDHLGMRSRRPTAVASLASVGAPDGDAGRIAAVDAPREARAKARSDSALLTGVCLMAPLLLLPRVRLCRPVSRRGGVERHAAEAGPRPVRAARRRPACPLGLRAHLSRLR